MKYPKIIALAFLVVGFSACSSSKTASSAGGANNAQQASTPSSRSTGTESNSNSIFSAGRSSTKKANSKTYQRTHADLVKEAEERQEANAKRRAKEAKMAEKPQYSDPSYFGHKKKPKKRPPGKQKMCKECGIKH